MKRSDSLPGRGLLIVLLATLAIFAFGIPGVARFVHDHRRLTVGMAVATIFAVWAVLLWRKRDSTPEFSKEVKLFLIVVSMATLTVFDAYAGTNLTEPVILAALGAIFIGMAVVVWGLRKGEAKIILILGLSASLTLAALALWQALTGTGPF